MNNLKMHKILFICHGNICRSPMAEFVMKYLVEQAGLSKEFKIESAATSTEEIGNNIHPGAKAKLTEKKVPFTSRHARQIKIDDYEDYDLLIGMDSENIYYMKKILGEDTEHKMHKLLEYAGSSKDVADPWFTGDFDSTYNDVLLGCKGLLSTLTK